MLTVEFEVKDSKPSQANSDIIARFMDQIEENFEPIDGAKLKTMYIQNLKQTNSK